MNRNEISALILQISAKIELIKNSTSLQNDDKTEAINLLNKAKEGLREAKYFIGLAEPFLN